MNDNHIMIFDTETTGLPKNWKAPMKQLDNWPRVIQLAWTLVDHQGVEKSWGNYLIKPDGWEVPVEKFWLDHGFTQARLEAEGKPLRQVCDLFIADLQSAGWLVSHNMDFDYMVTGAELLRLGMSSERKPTRVCTKEAATEFCKLPFDSKQRRYPGSSQRYKWPKLEELHRKLFGCDFQNAHDAHGDVYALKACLFELIRLNIIKLAA